MKHETSDEPSGLTPFQTFLKEAYKSGKYKTKRGIDWRKLADDNPKFKDEWSYTSGKAIPFQRAQQMLSKLIKKKRRKVAQTEPQEDTAVNMPGKLIRPDQTHINRSVMSVMDACRYCPRCGLDQSIIHRAIMMGFKLA